MKKENNLKDIPYDRRFKLMPKFKQRLLIMCNIYFDGVISRLAEYVKYPGLNKLINDDMQCARNSTIRSIASNLGVDPEWLIIASNKKFLAKGEDIFNKGALQTLKRAQKEFEFTEEATPAQHANVDPPPMLGRPRCHNILLTATTRVEFNSRCEIDPDVTDDEAMDAISKAVDATDYYSDPEYWAPEDVEMGSSSDEPPTHVIRKDDKGRIYVKPIVTTVSLGQGIAPSRKLADAC